MIHIKPKQFHFIYESGVRGDHHDPITGKAWFTLSWKTIKNSMAKLAASAGEDLTLINDRTGNFITVSPEGKWR